MFFSKAIDHLRVAEMATTRFDGIALQDVCAEFGCDHRTGQRDADRRKRWHMPRHDPRWLRAQGIRDSELAALKMAVKRAERDGAPDDAARLQSLKDRLLAAMPSSKARRTEANAEALLEAQGFASRPGPRVVSDLQLMGVLTEALRAPWELKIRYRGTSDEAPTTRLLEPYGLLLGVRRYLVARPSGGDRRMRRFRLDWIETAEITSSNFARHLDFDLSGFAAQSFGSFHSESEFGPVFWRFSSETAATARQFVFHPNQEVTEEDDGSLTVQFAESGHLDMAWNIYQ